MNPQRYGNLIGTRRNGFSHLRDLFSMSKAQIGLRFCVHNGRCYNERFHCIYFVPVFSSHNVVLQTRAIADNRLGKKMLERGIGNPTFVQEKGRGCANLGSVPLTLMLQVANLAITKSCVKSDKFTETLAYGTHLRVLSESYPMNTNMTEFRWFS